jgi:hypothetical protein
MPVSYGSVVVVKVGEKGVALSIIFPFRLLLHRSIFLPWAEVADCALHAPRRRATVTVRTYHPDYQLEFRGAPVDTIYRSYNQSRNTATDSAGS